MAEVIDFSEERHVSRAWLVVAGWAALGLTFALILYAQVGVPLPYAVLSAVVNYSVLGAEVWAAAGLVGRLEVWRWPPLRASGLHVALGLLVTLGWFAAQVAVMRTMLGPDSWTIVFSGTWMFHLLTTAATYGAAMGLAVTVQAHDRERARQEHEARLALAAQQSELSAIKAQLQPHFLLNALNSAVALLDDSPDEARAMLIRLGSLLQSIFDRLEQPSVPLARELDTVRDYLDVERIRFGDRLRYAIDAAPGAADVAVPPFILQPLVENAIRHGIEPLARPGTVHVGARRNGSVLHVEITDTGNGFADGTAPRGGRGLDLTARRLSTLYGARAALDFRSGPGGFTAHLQLPIDDRP